MDVSQRRLLFIAPGGGPGIFAGGNAIRAPLECLFFATWSQHNIICDDSPRCPNSLMACETMMNVLQSAASGACISVGQKAETCIAWRCARPRF